jgi:hypothetical protein
MIANKEELLGGLKRRRPVRCGNGLAYPLDEASILSFLDGNSHRYDRLITS